MRYLWLVSYVRVRLRYRVQVGCRNLLASIKRTVSPYKHSIRTVHSATQADGVGVGRCWGAGAEGQRDASAHAAAGESAVGTRRIGGITRPLASRVQHSQLVHDTAVTREPLNYPQPTGPGHICITSVSHLYTER
jgi:hypothetical protein